MLILSLSAFFLGLLLKSHISNDPDEKHFPEFFNCTAVFTTARNVSMWQHWGPTSLTARHPVDSLSRTPPLSDFHPCSHPF